MPLGEFELIAAHFGGHRAGPDTVLGVGDDAALLHCDAPICVTHAGWFATDVQAALPEAVALAEGLVAQVTEAMSRAAARPRWLTLALTLEQAPGEWLRRFSTALHAAGARRGLELVGGDTTRGRPAIDLYCLGPRRRPAPRP